MPTFSGFPSGKIDFVRIPEQFFNDLLPTIDNLGELKITLFALWFLDRQEATVRFVTYNDFLTCNLFPGIPSDHLRAYIDNALGKAVNHGIILCIQPVIDSYENALFFLNTPRGRAAIKAYQAGDWLPEADSPLPKPVTNRPNIFSLYEENIGPLTPMMADTLQEAENTYPMEWIEEAIAIAVHNNVRRWRYIEAILESWKEKGHNEKVG